MMQQGMLYRVTEASCIAYGCVFGVEIPATECLQTVGSKLWLRFDVKMIDTATGAALDCIGGHLCPMVRIWLHEADGGKDIENVFSSPWAGGWDVDGDYNRCDAVVESTESWTAATKVELHLDGGPDGSHSTIVDNLSLVPSHPYRWM